MNKVENLFHEAENYLVAGASAGQRFNGVLGYPLYMDHADGAYLYDLDGNRYIDYHGGSGAALFGHNNKKIKKALEKALERGFFMNYDTEDTVELAKLVRAIFPSCEKSRLANTGSEATQGAIRLARGYTGRPLVAKFEGHFHGMHENIWFNHNGVHGELGDGLVETVADSLGFQENAKDNVIVIKFNDLEALETAFAKYKGQIACLIMEPVSFNCGCLECVPGFLEAVREICTREGAILIFDEVITGLRMAPGSAQKRFGVYPDMTTTAKAIGGGIPISLIGGRKEIMDWLSPKGPVAMSGTYTGALMSVMASVACLKMALEPGFYEHIEELAAKLYPGIDGLFKKYGIPGHCRGVGARFSIYFGIEDPAYDYDFRTVAKKFDREMDKKFVKYALQEGLWFHDTSTKITPAHRALMSAHSKKDIEDTLERLDTVFGKLK